MDRRFAIARILAVPLLIACEAGVFRTAVKTPTEPGTPPPRVTRTVTIGDNFFNPNPLTVTPGTRVFWVHQGSDFHSVLFEPPNFFFSGVMARTEQTQRLFNSPGVYTYHCTVHEDMRATIHVRE